MISFICGILKIQQTSEYNTQKSRLTDLENKLVVTSGGGGKRYKPIGIKKHIEKEKKK